MAVNQTYLNYLLGQLSEVEDFTCKKMFGGMGFFSGDGMWGAIIGNNDTLGLKVDETNQARFEKAGMRPFEMEKRGKQITLSYWTVPEDVVADRAKLADWVAAAAEVAKRKKKKKE